MWVCPRSCVAVQGVQYSTLYSCPFSNYCPLASPHRPRNLVTSEFAAIPPLFAI